MGITPTKNTAVSATPSNSVTVFLLLTPTPTSRRTSKPLVSKLKTSLTCARDSRTAALRTTPGTSPSKALTLVSQDGSRPPSVASSPAVFAPLLKPLSSPLRVQLLLLIFLKKPLLVSSVVVNSRSSLPLSSSLLASLPLNNKNANTNQNQQIR